MTQAGETPSEFGYSCNHSCMCDQTRRAIGIISLAFDRAIEKAKDDDLCHNLLGVIKELRLYYSKEARKRLIGMDQ